MNKWSMYFHEFLFKVTKNMLITLKLLSPSTKYDFVMPIYNNYYNYHLHFHVKKECNVH